MLRKIFVFVLCLVIGLAFAANASVITYRDGDEWSEAKYSGNKKWQNKMNVSFYDSDTDMAMAVNYRGFLELEKSDSDMPDPDITVTVKVQELQAGNALVTVDEIGKNAPAIAYNVLDWYQRWPFYPIIGEQGVKKNKICHTDMLVDYNLTYKFYIDDPKDPLPCWYDIDAAHRISIQFYAIGTGTILKTAYGFTEGNSAQVEANQKGLWNTGGASTPGKDLFPTETVSIQEL